MPFFAVLYLFVDVCGVGVLVIAQKLLGLSDSNLDQGVNQFDDTHFVTATLKFQLTRVKKR